MSNERKRREALVYHSKPEPGKIKVIPSKKYRSQTDLALAYSPGVAYPCLEIDKNPDDVYKYTSKSNLVAVISNGTHIRKKVFTFPLCPLIRLSPLTSTSTIDGPHKGHKS